jgi:WD40 repeat protein
MDADGDLDLVTCFVNGPAYVAWYRNNDGGASNFTPLIVGSVDNCQAIQVADIDRDGTLDILAGGYDLDEIVYFANDGTLPTPAWERRVIAEDPDGEGGIEQGALDGPRSVRAGDLDGDGDVDIAVASDLDDRVSWFESDGLMPPSFTLHVLTDDLAGGDFDAFANEPRKVRLEDIDDDGDLDLLFSSRADDQIGWFDNDGAMPPTFEARTITRDPDGPAVYVKVPIVENPQFPSDYRGVAESGGRPGRTDGVTGFAIGDIDGDGDLDIASASANDSKIAWHDNRSCEVVFPFQPPIASGQPDGAASVVSADLDGDGDMDVVAASSNDDSVRWYENDGELFPSFVSRFVTTSAGGAQTVHVADVDGDGALDILVAAPRANKVSWFESDGGSPPAFTEQIVTSAAAGPRGVHGADIDGDGDTDILTATSADRSITLWSNVGGSPPMFEPEVVSRGGLSPWAVKAADLNDDGRLDILYAAISSGRVAWLRASDEGWVELDIAPGTEGGTGAVTGVAQAAIDLVTADVDGDGALDVISVSAHDDKVAWYRNSATEFPTFTEYVVSEDPDGPTQILLQSINPDVFVFSGTQEGAADGASSVAAADLDDDGDVDIAVTAVLDNAVAWFENDGDGALGTNLYRGVTKDSDAARSVVAVDLNGDDRTDLVSGAFRSDTVDWYLSADDDACIVFDADGDGQIDASELVMLGRAFGADESPQAGAETPWWFEIDLNGDGRVDGQDLSLLGSSGVWGQTVLSCRLSCAAAPAGD